MAVTAAAGASKYIQDFHKVRTYLSLLAAEEEGKVEWKKTFEEVIHTKNLNETGLSFKVEAPMSIDKMKIHMRKKQFVSPSIETEFSCVWY